MTPKANAGQKKEASVNKGKGKRKTKATKKEDKSRPVGHKGMGKRKANALDEQPGKQHHVDAEIQQVRSKRQSKANANDEDDKDDKAKRTTDLNPEDFDLPANWKVQGVRRIGEIDSSSLRASWE